MLPKIPRRGDPLRINSRSFAAALRAGEAFEQSRLAKGGLSLTGFGAEQALVVNLVNTSGDVLPQFSLVGLGDVRRMGEIDGELPQIVHDWVQPATDEVIGILLVELGEEETGRVLLTGETWARVMHPCAGTRADAYGGNNHLVSSPGGRVLITGKPSGDDPDPPEVALMAVLITQGAGNNCVNTWWLSDGATDPAGGTITFDLTINGVTDDVTLSIPSTIAQTITALELHSEIASGDVTIIGGTLPEVAQRITFRNNPTNIELASNSLTASWDAPPTLRLEPA